MALGLKFISGKYQGGEFAIPEEGELIIGRASELDLVLAEDMVSRKHAKLVAHGTSVSITDLGSTNGTFVNGEKVKRAELKRGDRVLIGTSILKIVAANDLHDSTSSDRAQLKSMMQELGERAPSASAMSGDLSEVPLPDLLQLFATNKKAGTLSINGPGKGRIYIKQGRLLYASIEGESMRAFKALCRMLSWDRGSFQLDPYDEGAQFPETFQESTESILIEALRQCDEIRRAQSELPPMHARVSLAQPLVPKLSGLSTSELDTLQLAVNHGVLRTIVEKADGSDHETITNLHRLLRDGYLAVK